MKYIIGPIIFLSIFFLIDWYAFQSVKAALSSSANNVKRIAYTLYWSVTVITVLTMLSNMFIDYHYWPRHLRTYLFSIIMTIFFCKLLLIIILLGEDIFRGARFALLKFFPKVAPDPDASHITRSQFLSRSGILLAGIPFAASFYGIIKNAYNYQVHRVTVNLPNLPEAFNGLKILQISDVHSGSFNDKAKVERGIRMMEELKPDLIFFTGDLVNDIADEMVDYKTLFARLKAPLGIYSCTGNHDYGDYVAWPSREAKEANFKRLLETHHEMGWKVLMNEHVILEREGGKLAVIGIENWSNVGRFPKYGSMKKAYPGAEAADVKLLLSHDPSHWDAQVRTEYPDIDVMFSGHTHGFQMGVENKYIKWSPSQFMYKQWAGLYQEGKQYLYVNRGFGFLGYPGRIGILPEITLMELRKA